MGLLKDIYSASFYNRFSNTLQEVVPSFNKREFMQVIFSDHFEDKEWKDRMKHTTRIFHQFLPKDFPEAVKLIEKIITKLRNDGEGGGLEFIFFADYIETYGLDDFETSVKALEFITQFISCEFAVRPFILKYGDRMIQQMVAWSTHENYKVRRFSSEGSRPRLPWAMAIPALKKDPESILPILENLKNDPSEFVRRSVANNINDIAKDHPAIVVRIATQWKGISKETDAIVKHGSRTLLKSGHAEILKHYGLESENIALSDFVILTPTVKIGDELEFSCSVKNNNLLSHTARLEYGIYYKRGKGQMIRKVFKISEKILGPGETVQVRKKQSFKLITTRRFYTGEHQLSIIINGEEKGIKTFTILEA